MLWSRSHKETHVLPDDPPFWRSDLKLSRARHHISELSALTRDYLSRKPFYLEITSVRPPNCHGVAVRVEDGRDRKHYWVGRTRLPIPLSLCAVLGDAIHNLRAALDLMACELVRRAGHADDQVYFPFAKDAGTFEAMLKKRHLDRASPSAQELIRSLEPYWGGNEDLRGLHELDIVDKHRTVIVMLASIRISRITLNQPGLTGEIRNAKMAPLVDGKVLVILPRDPMLREGQHVIPETELEFSDPPFKGQEILTTMSRLADVVSDIVARARLT